MSQWSEQNRAQDALARAKTIGKDLQESYLSYVDALGPSIIRNGLGQALATEKAAAGSKPETPGDRAHGRLQENVSRWLTREGGPYPGADDVLQAIIAGDQDKYVEAQIEALAWLDWHKKFCHAYLQKGKEK